MIKIITLQIIITAAYGAYFGFVPVYLSKNGFSNEWIGILLAISAATTTINQFVIGFINDRHLSVKKSFIIMCVLSMFGVFVCTFIMDNYLLTAFMIGIVGFAFSPLPNVSSSWINRISTDNEAKLFAYSKAFGAVACMLAVILCGIVYGNENYYFLPYITLVLLALSVISSLTINDVPVEKVHSTGIFNFFLEIIKNKLYLLAVVICFCFFVALTSVSTFLSLQIVVLGGSGLHVGIYTAIGAITEAVAYILVVKSKISISKLFIIASLSMLTKAIIAFFAISDIAILLVSQGISGFAMAFIVLGTLRLINATIPKNRLMSATMLYFAVQGGISGIVSYLVGGQISQYLGIFAVVVFGSIVSLITLLLCIILVIMLKNQKSAINLG